MFRMLQAVEREPTSVLTDMDNNESKKMTTSLNVIKPKSHYFKIMF